MAKQVYEETPEQREERLRREREQAAQQVQETAAPAVEVTPQPAVQTPVQTTPQPAPAPQAQQPTTPPTLVDVLNASNTYADAINQSSQGLADTMRTEGQKRIDAINQAGTQYGQELAAANQAYQDKSEAVWQQLNDIATGTQNRINEANEQAGRERKAALNASRWTGLTELAASIANLVGVGGFNAVNQEYKSVQNDWMKKAEDDMRVHRSRIDNLNARLEDQRMRLEQLKLGDAQTAFENAMRAAGVTYETATKGADAAYENAVYPAQILSQGQQAAAQARLQGVTAGYEGAINERKLANDEAAQQASISQGWAKINEDKRQFNETQRLKERELNITAGRYGLNPDGTDNPNSSGYAGGRGTSSSSSSSSGGGSSSGNKYEVTVGNRRFIINLNTETHKQALLNGKGYIRQDVEEILQEKQNEIDKLSGRDKRRAQKQADIDNREYTDVLEAIRGTGDPKADNETIEAFVQSHGPELENYNISLLRLAGYEVNETPAAQTQATPAAQAPAVQRDSTLVQSSEDFFNKVMNSK